MFGHLKKVEHLTGKVGKRRYKRFVVENMDIHAKTLLAAETELLDISVTGACITAQKSLRFADKHLIKLESEGKHLPVQCTIIWKNLIGSAKNLSGEFVPVYKAGIAFKGISSDKLVRLKDFIRMSGIPKERRVRDEYGPSALRFKIDNNKKAVLYYQRTSMVKKISLGGMLIELYNGIKVDKRFPMALFLPNEDRQIRFQGRVASCIEIPGNKLRHDIGIEFIDMQENDKSRLSKFLHFLEEKTE
jgi:c-di-GMP-binding flagellar brake protein YcgR